MMEIGLFGKRVETKSLRSTGFGIFVPSPRPPHRAGTLVSKRLVWRRAVKADGPAPEVECPVGKSWGSGQRPPWNPGGEGKWPLLAVRVRSERGRRSLAGEG